MRFTSLPRPFAFRIVRPARAPGDRPGRRRRLGPTRNAIPRRLRSRRREPRSTHDLRTRTRTYRCPAARTPALRRRGRGHGRGPGPRGERAHFLCFSVAGYRLRDTVAGYMRDTYLVSRVSGGSMYRCHLKCHHHVQRTYQATHCLLVCKWVFSSPLELPRPIICFGMATLIQP